MTPMRSSGLLVAVVMVVLGAVWTGQGLGWIGGSSMSGRSEWAVIGPIVAGLGIALAWVILQRVRHPPPDDGLGDRYGRH